MENYAAINKALWNQKTSVHIASDFYNMKAFRQGESSLKPIELDFLGAIKGQTLLHLQCHFGQDTLSLARLGASVSGVDLSDEAIAAAKQLSEELAIPAQFYMGNVLELEQILPATAQYDLIFSSYGTIGWLPELKSWARHIGRYLKPGGRFVLVDFHPTLWMFSDDFKGVAYSYFNTEVIIEQVEGSYADRTAAISAKAYSWNHAFDEIFSALLIEGALQLKRFEEFDYSPYDCFQNTVPCEKGFQIKGLEGNLPMLYAMEWIKP